MKFLRSEVGEILVSIAVLLIAASGLNPNRLLIFSFPLVLAFIIHEMSHKLAAGRYGFLSVYRSWMLGLLIALVLGLASHGKILFAAPGAVVVLSGFHTREIMGKISLAGPLSNLLLATIFLPLINLQGFAGEITRSWVRVNAMLSFFNLLPVVPLDGSKIIVWNFKVWAIVFISALLCFVFV